MSFGNFGFSEMLIGKRAAAHVGPEVEKPQDKRNRSKVVSCQRRGGGATQQMRRFVDEIESAFAWLSTARAFH